MLINIKNIYVKKITFILRKNCSGNPASWVEDFIKALSA